MDLSWMPIWVQALVAVGITFTVLGLLVIAVILFDHHLASPGYN